MSYENQTQAKDSSQFPIKSKFTVELQILNDIVLKLLKYSQAKYPNR